MELRDHIEHREGNTKSSRIVPSKYWCFTLNNYTEMEMETLETIFKDLNIEYGFGKEIMGKNGTPYLHGWIDSPKKIRPMEKFKNKRIHWEKNNGNRKQNIAYCSKEGDYKTNIFSLAQRMHLLNLPLPDQLYPWQQVILTLIDLNPERQIIWRWSKNGNTGKTTFAKFLTETRGAILIDGEKSDILYAAARYVSNFDRETLFSMKIIFILDFSRTVENFISYDALEKLKNGLWFSPKYKSKMVLFPPPTVLIFTNFSPKYDLLSADRWNVENVDTPDIVPRKS